MNTRSPVVRSADSGTSNRIVSWLSQVGPVRWHGSGPARTRVAHREPQPVARLQALHQPVERAHVEMHPLAAAPHSGADHRCDQRARLGDQRPAGLGDRAHRVRQAGRGRPGSPRRTRPSAAAAGRTRAGKPPPTSTISSRDARRRASRHHPATSSSGAFHAGAASSATRRGTPPRTAAAPGRGRPAAGRPRPRLDPELALARHVAVDVGRGEPHHDVRRRAPARPACRARWWSRTRTAAPPPRTCARSAPGLDGVAEQHVSGVDPEPAGRPARWPTRSRTRHRAFERGSTGGYPLHFMA